MPCIIPTHINIHQVRSFSINIPASINIYHFRASNIKNPASINIYRVRAFNIKASTFTHTKECTHVLEASFVCSMRRSQRSQSIAHGRRTPSTLRRRIHPSHRHSARETTHHIARLLAICVCIPCFCSMTQVLFIRFFLLVFPHFMFNSSNNGMSN